MATDLKDPKTLIIAALALAGAGGLGHTLGITVEPASVTDLRIENARLEVRVEVLENIAAECNQVLTLARTRLVAENEQ